MKKAIVTGANGQLGKGFLETLLNEGFFVYAIDLNFNENKNSENIKTVKLDITNEKEVKNFFNSIDEIDVLINNAGIGVFTSFEERTVAEFKKVMDVNLLGTFLMSQQAVSIMKKQKKGKIVNIGSIYGQVSSDFRIYGDSGRNNSEIYSATKAGIIMMTKYMAANFASYNIQTNCISPGGIFNNQSDFFIENYTFRNPTGKMANVEDMQGALKLLISQGSNYINGQNITVDGGFTAW